MLHDEVKARHDQVISAIDAQHARLATCAARCAGCGVPLLPDAADVATLSLTLRNGAGPTIAFCACRSCLLDAERARKMLRAVETRSKPPNRPALPITQGDLGGRQPDPSKRLQGPEIH